MNITYSFVIFVGIFISYSSSSNFRKTSIAIAAQGKAEDVAVWIKMMSLMETKNISALFILSFDFPINKSICDNGARITCLFHPQSTWRTGRNALTRSIAEYETSNTHNFKYWMFGDSDIIRIESCKIKASPYKSLTLELAAFCFDSIVHRLSSDHVQYAVVSYKSLYQGNLLAEDKLGFLHGDCCDAALIAIHHLAAPVLLPYVELLDNITWWAPIWNHLIIGCFPGYSVYWPGFQYDEKFQSHAAYPRYHYNASSLKTKAFRQVYGRVDLIPYPITEENANALDSAQGNCAHISSAQVADPSWSSDAWQKLDSFKKCSHQLHSRFRSFLQGVDLMQIDGKNY